MFKTINARLLVFFACLCLVATSSVVFLQHNLLGAACNTPAADRGQVTYTINVTTAGNYRFWTRMQAADANNNSVTVQVDDNICNVVVGDNAAISSSALSWIDYQAGTTTNKVNMNLTAGNHTFYVIGREDNVIIDRFLLTADTACVPTGNGANCIVVADTSPPSVSVTAPANNATVSGTTNITANASDNAAVAKVEFYVDNVKVGEDTTSPYSFSWNTTAHSNAAHTVLATAIDDSSNSASASVSVTVNNTTPDTTPPTVNLTAPAANATVTGTVAINATASDNGTVAKVEFYVDNVKLGEDTTSPYAFNWTSTTATNASHTIRATAIDAANNTANSSRTVTVNNPPPDTTPPIVTLTTPANNATVSGATVAINANATDTVGVSKVSFYIGTTLLSEDTSSPYTAVWNTTALTNGSYLVRAIATDTSSNSATTQANVTVNNATPPKKGDCSGDGRVDINDLTIVVLNYGKNRNTRTLGDLNNDGKVDISDLTELVLNYGK